MGKVRKKQLELFESPNADLLDTFIPKLWAYEVRKDFTQSIAWNMAKKMDYDILKALAEEKAELNNNDIEKALEVLAADDSKRTATEMAMLVEQQRQQSDKFRAQLMAQQQATQQQDALLRRGLSNDYLRQGFGMAALDQEEFLRKYAQAIGAEQIFKDRAKSKATEEEMRGILSMITAADLIINFMNSGFNDFRGWLNAYINANLESYRERQTTKTDIGGVDPVTEDTPRTILSGE